MPFCTLRNIICAIYVCKHVVGMPLLQPWLKGEPLTWHHATHQNETIHNLSLEWRHMSVKASQITDNLVVGSTAYFRSKSIKVPHYLPCVNGIPKRADYVENISMSWRHHITRDTNIAHDIDISSVVCVTDIICDDLSSDYVLRTTRPC